jgi:hypothetical protein
MAKAEALAIRVLADWRMGSCHDASVMQCTTREPELRRAERRRRFRLLGRWRGWRIARRASALRGLVWGHVRSPGLARTDGGGALCAHRRPQGGWGFGKTSEPSALSRVPCATVSSLSLPILRIA